MKSSYKYTLLVYGLSTIGILWASNLTFAQDWYTPVQMQAGRSAHSSVLMNDGRVLITGGGPDRETGLALAEVFDFRYNTIEQVADMHERRILHSSVVLDDGRVLVAGGTPAVGSSLNSCEIFDPATDTWHLTGDMNFGRNGFAMVKLKDGRVMALGGIGHASPQEEYSTTERCEIFDPVTETWTETAPMPNDRNGLAAMVLDDGRVYATSGYASRGPTRPDCQIYNPASDSWDAVKWFPDSGTGDHKMTKLPNGELLRTGGWPGPQTYSHLYNPQNDSWRQASVLNTSRHSHVQLTMPDGRTYVLGGMTSERRGPQEPTDDVEFFDMEWVTWHSVEPLPEKVANLTGHILPNGQLIIIGGAVSFTAASRNIHVSNFDDVSSARRVSGTVWYDIDGNGILDDQDRPAEKVKLEGLKGSFASPFTHFSDVNGDYELILPLGKHQICVADQLHWEVVALDNNAQCYTEDIQDVGLELSDRNFVLTPRHAIQDLDMSIVSSQPRPGFALHYYINIRNTGTLPFSGQILFEADPILKFVSSSWPGDMMQGSLLAWNADDLPVGAEHRIVLEYSVPADVGLLGYELCAAIRTDKDNRDELLREGHDIFCSEIRGAYDPNEIVVSPRGIGDKGAVNYDDTFLSYTIYFQNLGTGTAFNVRILNQLDRYLESGSFQLGNSSHPVDVAIDSEGLVKFTFDDIRLPHKAVNEPGSQGFVRYYVKAKKPLGKENLVHNLADIYFDFNPPIRTNTARTTVVNLTTSVDSKQPPAADVRLFPNPAGEHVTLKISMGEFEHISLVDVLGQEQTPNLEFSGQEISLDVSALQQGVYWLTVVDKAGMRHTQTLTIRR